MPVFMICLSQKILKDHTSQFHQNAAIRMRKSSKKTTYGRKSLIVLPFRKSWLKNAVYIPSAGHEIEHRLQQAFQNDSQLQKIKAGQVTFSTSDFKILHKLVIYVSPADMGKDSLKSSNK